VTYYIESNVQEMKRALVGAGVPSHKVKFTDIFKLPT